MAQSLSSHSDPETNGASQQHTIAPVRGLSDNGARIRHGHGDSDESFSAVQRIYYAAAGRAADIAGCDGADRAADAPGGVAVLGAIFIFWGVRAATRPEAKAARVETMIRAGSLALVGIFILAVPFVPARHASQLFMLAGGVLVLRGALAAADFGRAPLISRQPTKSKSRAFALASRARSG